jgi:HAD superfamily hydrolase (TIGR01509 family)
VKLACVIWDLDGTLSDSAALHFRAWVETMALYGVEYTHELFGASFGRNNFEILSEQMPHFSSAKISQVSEEKETAYRQLLEPGALELLPAVEQWLAAFAALGLPQVIGSSAPMANIVAMLDVLGIGDSFHAILSGYRLPRGKPDPLLFLRCAKAVEVPPEACLVIEDSIHGIEAAQRAGMPCIAVGPITRGEALAPFLRGGGPRCLATETLADVSLERIVSLYT